LDFEETGIKLSMDQQYMCAYSSSIFLFPYLTMWWWETADYIIDVIVSDT